MDQLEQFFQDHIFQRSSPVHRLHDSPNPNPFSTRIQFTPRNFRNFSSQSRNLHKTLIFQFYNDDVVEQQEIVKSPLETWKHSLTMLIFYWLLLYWFHGFCLVLFGSRSLLQFVDYWNWKEQQLFEYYSSLFHFKLRKLSHLNLTFSSKFTI